MLQAICLALASLLTVQIEPTQIWFVNASATGANTGTSWQNAFIELQSALALANGGDQVWVAEGTYLPDFDLSSRSHTGNRAASFSLSDGVKLYGGFQGTELTVVERAGLIENTVLSGDIGYTGFANDNSYHVISCYFLGPSSVVDGFTITGGMANQFPENLGGGVYALQSNAVFHRCRFVHNHAYSGGAIYNNQGSLVIESCLLEENSSDYSGGGIGNTLGGSSLIKSSIFTRNTATVGGGISNMDSSPVIVGSLFEANEAHERGGAIYDWSDGLPLIDDCSFCDNVAGYGAAIAFEQYAQGTVSNCQFRGNFSYSRAGAIDIYLYSSPVINNCSFVGNRSLNEGGALGSDYQSSPKILNCEFHDNEARSSGGAIFDLGGEILLYRTIFTRNEAGSSGGALFNLYGAMTVQSSVFLANRSYYGGAISIGVGESQFQNCTILGNEAKFGGASYNSFNSNSLRISNSIVHKNIADSQFRGMTSIRYSLVQGGYAGVGNVDLNPVFISPPDGGNDGWGDDPATPFIDEGSNDDFGDLRLQRGSPAINAGDPDFVPETGESDLDGHARVLCGRVDMGAYEFGIGDVNCDQTVDLGDFAAWPPCSLGATPLPGECVPLDFDNDKDVDLVDFARLQRLNWIK